MDEKRGVIVALIAGEMSRRDYHFAHSGPMNDNSPRHYMEWYAATRANSLAQGIIRTLYSDEEARAIYAEAQKEAAETTARMDDDNPPQWIEE